MATDVETLMVRLEASAAKFEREMKRAGAVADRSMRDVEGRIDRSMRNVNERVTQGASAINTALATIGVGGGLSLAGLVAFSSEYTRLLDQIKSAGSGVDASAAFGDLTKAAISSNVPLSQTVELFKALSVAGRETGAGYAENISLIETFSRALNSEGKSASDVADALQSLSQELQFGEGEASDYLEVLQEAPRLFDLVAQKLGVTKEALREQINESDISAGKLQQAILAVKPQVDTTFKDQSAQVGAALTNIGTALADFISKSGIASEASSALAGALNVIAQNLPAIADAAITVGSAIAITLTGAAIVPLIATIGSAAIPAITAFVASIGTIGLAASAANLGVSSLGGGFALLTSPAGILIGSVALITGGLYALKSATDPAKEAAAQHAASIKKLDDAIRLANEALPGTIDNVRALAKADIEAAAAALKNAQAQYEVAKAARARLGVTVNDPNQDIGLKDISAAESRLAELQKKEADFEAKLKSGGFKSNLKLTPPSVDSGDGAGGAGGADKKDAFEKEIQQFEKKIELAKVDLQTVGLSIGARERLRAVVELEQAAQRAGITLSEEQKAKIQELSTAYGNIRQSVENATTAQQDMISLQKFIGQNVSSFFSDVVSGGKNAEEALMNLVKRLSEAALQAALLGDGPLASLFGTKGENGGVGGLIGGLFKGFAGGFASGGTVPAGQYALVGERGPELLAPSSSPRMVIPNHQIPKAGGASSQPVNITHVFRVENPMGDQNIKDLLTTAAMQSRAIFRRDFASVATSYNSRQA